MAVVRYKHTCCSVVMKTCPSTICLVSKLAGQLCSSSQHTLNIGFAGANSTLETATLQPADVEIDSIIKAAMAGRQGVSFVVCNCHRQLSASRTMPCVCVLLESVVTSCNAAFLPGLSAVAIVGFSTSAKSKACML